MLLNQDPPASLSSDESDPGDDECAVGKGLTYQNYYEFIHLRGTIKIISLCYSRTNARAEIVRILQ